LLARSPMNPMLKLSISTEGRREAP
jgi:hypothetical protein